MFVISAGSTPRKVSFYIHLLNTQRKVTFSNTSHRLTGSIKSLGKAEKRSLATPSTDEDTKAQRAEPMHRRTETTPGSSLSLGPAPAGPLLVLGGPPILKTGLVLSHS